MTGYSIRSKAYRVFNKRTQEVEESIHIVFNKTNFLEIKNDDDYELGLKKLSISEENEKEHEEVEMHEEAPSEVQVETIQKESEVIHEELLKEWRYHKSHQMEQIIGNSN
ncbi:hypothetical protein Ancab_008052 [Ancistrocladus abbreviatus]